MAHKIDVFDSAYRDRIHSAVWKAVLEASIAPETNVAAVRNHEVYDALIAIEAMILATSKQADSPTKIRQIAEEHSKKLRRRVASFKAEFAKRGTPMDVVHTDDMQ